MPPRWRVGRPAVGRERRLAEPGRRMPDSPSRSPYRADPRGTANRYRLRGSARAAIKAPISAPSTQPRVMIGNESSPASGLTSPTGPETTRTPCAVASTAVAVNRDHARRLAVGALTTRTPTLPEEPRHAPSSRLGGPSESTGLRPLPFIRSAMCARPPSLDPGRRSLDRHR